MSALLLLVWFLVETFYRSEDHQAQLNERRNTNQTSAADAAQLVAFYTFRRGYFGVYLCIMLADWMQGTHMYTLYLSYGFNISALFLTGFLSGAVFAPFLGSLVDKFGRKRSCLVYCALEIVINVLEHYANFNVLLLGRILGGISTNLLFSAFESWMTTEHRRKGFPEEWLSRTYSICSIGNGTVAIVAGIVAQVLEDYLGHIGPFQGAVALSGLALLLILRWGENYGEEHAGDHASSSLSHQFLQGWKTTFSDSRVLRIGLTQALSEGAMYTWVFTWVPSLLSLNPPGGVPTGCVFSALMIAVTIGGIVYSPLQSFVKHKLAAKNSEAELFASLIYLLASVATALPVLCLSYSTTDTMMLSRPTFCLDLVMISFLVFELCVGLFMPVAGTLRSKYVPDALQGAILNIFRLPLNFIVVTGTYATNHLEASLVYKLISGCFLLAALLQATLIPQKLDVSEDKKKS
jgi:MFS transporter, MFS domain-containing protein family, molybdate-anion transporter